MLHLLCALGAFVVWVFITIVCAVIWVGNTHNNDEYYLAMLIANYVLVLITIMAYFAIRSNGGTL